MESLNDHIIEYNHQLSKGHIQKAYQGIIQFMSGVKSSLEANHPDYNTSSLYFGYMDMTYFAFTPPDLREKKLKIAIVYLHEKGIFEAWLAGNNKKIQSKYIVLMEDKPLPNYRLSQALPGVDSIVESILVDQPDFDQPENLKNQIEANLLAFISDITQTLSE